MSEWMMTGRQALSRGERHALSPAIAIVPLTFAPAPRQAHHLSKAVVQGSDFAWG